MNKHTPGPWEYEVNDNGTVIVKDGYSIASTFGTRAITGDELPHEANATLIAAAPAMLVALRKATQLASIACDWHLEEVEIDGEMIDTHELVDEFESIITLAEPTT